MIYFHRKKAEINYNANLRHNILKIIYYYYVAFYNFYVNSYLIYFNYDIKWSLSTVSTGVQDKNQNKFIILYYTF
jgi:hypothetical protein